MRVVGSPLSGTPLPRVLRYWGRLRFPKDYPFRPPSILMVTPNGRFETNTRLCLSMSWSPVPPQSEGKRSSFGPMPRSRSALFGALTAVVLAGPAFAGLRVPRVTRVVRRAGDGLIPLDAVEPAVTSYALWILLGFEIKSLR